MFPVSFKHKSFLIELQKANIKKIQLRMNEIDSLMVANNQSILSLEVILFAYDNFFCYFP